MVLQHAAILKEANSGITGSGRIWETGVAEVRLRRMHADAPNASAGQVCTTSLEQVARWNHIALILPHGRKQSTYYCVMISGKWRDGAIAYPA